MEKTQRSPRASRIGISLLFFFFGFIFASWASRIPSNPTTASSFRSRIGCSSFVDARRVIYCTAFFRLFQFKIWKQKCCYRFHLYMFLFADCHWFFSKHLSVNNLSFSFWSRGKRRKYCYQHAGTCSGNLISKNNYFFISWNVECRRPCGCIAGYLFYRKVVPGSVSLFAGFPLLTYVVPFMRSISCSRK